MSKRLGKRNDMKDRRGGEEQGKAIAEIPEEALTQAELDRLVEMRSDSVPTALFESDEDGSLRLDISTDRDSLLIRELFNTSSFPLAIQLCVQAGESIVPHSTDPRDKTLAANANLAMIKGINPKDELEAMLATQMAGVHNLAMEFTKRASLPEQTAEGVDMNVNRATKLMRTFTSQIKALNKYRGKGQQRMTVEHVHVNAGGQAIVGDVNVEGGKREISS